jgi:death-on-curing protein
MLFGIARNHAFEQGNKRTAFEAALIFLANNGYELRMPDSVELAETIVAVIEHKQTEMQFEAFIRPYVTPSRR